MEKKKIVVMIVSSLVFFSAMADQIPTDAKTTKNAAAKDSLIKPEKKIDTHKTKPDDEKAKLDAEKHKLDIEKHKLDLDRQKLEIEKRKVDAIKKGLAMPVVKWQKDDPTSEKSQKDILAKWQREQGDSMRDYDRKMVIKLAMIESARAITAIKQVQVNNDTAIVNLTVNNKACQVELYKGKSVIVREALPPYRIWIAKRVTCRR